MTRLWRTAALPPKDHIHKLELIGDDSDTMVLRNYERALLERLQDSVTIVIEVKGIGMDGHWGFHGRETPHDADPGYISRAPLKTRSNLAGNGGSG